MITTPRIQSYYNPRVSNRRRFNTQQRSAINNNIEPVVITLTDEIIDLSSPPSSPTPTPVQVAPLQPTVELELRQIPERVLTKGSKNNAAYKVNNLSYLLILLD